ncbi:glycosyltransferase family 4 protein [Flavobacteriaceae bacterium]|nr:glycosyltransferase family 4 protein [Flavobacteriaceae bacterium]
MKVLQLIDTLRQGGAELMAVNIANGLANNDVESYIITTRYSGGLVSKLIPIVSYVDFRRNGYFDYKLIFKIRSYCKEHSIKIIHAHTLSWKIAIVLKFISPSLNVIWHDHQGNRLQSNNKILKRVIHRFSGIISVNESLRDWARNNLGHSNVIYLPNFIEMGDANPEFNQAELNEMESEVTALKDTNPVNMDIPIRSQIKLNGPDGFKIICVANLRPQKDHLTLIRAFAQLSQKYPNVSLHLVGAESDQSYADQVKSEVTAHGLYQVYFYGAVEGVSDLLQQAQIGVLSSVSEGLPMALLEYAAAGLPVVTTDVGACREVIGDYGFVVPSKNPEELYRALSKTIEDYDSAIAKAEKLKAQVQEQYSEAAVIPRLIEFYKTL